MRSTMDTRYSGGQEHLVFFLILLLKWQHGGSKDVGDLRPQFVLCSTTRPTSPSLLLGVARIQVTRLQTIKSPTFQQQWMEPKCFPLHSESNQMVRIRAEDRFSDTLKRTIWRGLGLPASAAAPVPTLDKLFEDEMRIQWNNFKYDSNLSRTDY